MNIIEVLEKTKNSKEKILLKLESIFNINVNMDLFHINMLYEDILNCVIEESSYKFVFFIDFERDNCYKMCLINKETGEQIDNFFTVKMPQVANAEIDFKNLDEKLSEIDIATYFIKEYFELLNKNIQNNSDIKCIELTYENLPDQIKNIIDIIENNNIQEEEKEEDNSLEIENEYLGTINLSSDIIGVLNRDIKSCTCNCYSNNYNIFNIIAKDTPENHIVLVMIADTAENFLTSSAKIEAHNLDDLINIEDDFTFVGSYDKLKDLKENPKKLFTPFVKVVDNILVINSKNIIDDNIYITYNKVKDNNKIAYIFIVFDLDI